MSILHSWILKNGFDRSSSECESVSHTTFDGKIYYVPKVFADAFSPENPGSLILLDYHHNAGPGPDIYSGVVDREAPSSYNWIGGLIQAGYIREVFWVSGRDLLLPNREARRAWLERHLAHDSPVEADQKRGVIKILDWPELAELTSSGFSNPVGVAIDLSILTVDPGPSAAGFLSEMLDFIDDLQPAVVSLSMSSSYQPDPMAAWEWYAQSLQRLAFRRRAHLVAGPAASVPEGNEEARRWREWSMTPRFVDYGASFAPGLRLWSHAPQRVWQAIEEIAPEAGDETAEALLAILKDRRARREELAVTAGNTVLGESINEIRQYIISAFASGIRPNPTDLSVHNDGRYGLGVRFVRQFEERGCYFLYDSVSNFGAALELVALEAAFLDPRYAPLTMEELPSLDTEVSILGPMQRMERPEDFIPGLDSLIIEYAVSGESSRTLLQASIAVERNLSRIQFLETLARKAGLPPSSWADENISFYKASTVTLRLPFLSGT